MKQKRVLILGGDGYLGWPTAMQFSAEGWAVAVVDNFAKRQWENLCGVAPLLPIRTLRERIDAWKDHSGKKIESHFGDICQVEFLEEVFRSFRPDAVVHYGEQPSAPYSMRSREDAVYTQVNNVVGNLNLLFIIKKYNPRCHLVKLGTMGEYGTPNIDIEEGWLEIRHRGRKDRMLFPKKPGSFYHLSKVHDSANIEFACRIWGLAATDLNQGVVYGIHTKETRLDPSLATSFHYDHVFGTVLNRFVVQACLGVPLSVYGNGSQTRGYLNINDTLQCVRIAVLKPARPGEFRVFNQFTEQFSVQQIAEKVRLAALQMGLETKIQTMPNPRVEQLNHYYRARHTKLKELGLKPQLLTGAVIEEMLAVALENKHLANLQIIHPSITWK